jgi:glycerophosphoryl diester phosphodiesterase
MSHMSTLPIRPPLIVHHMAALDDMTVPQNSLEAIAACLAAGAAVVEVDITALADRDYLLVHERLLESETSGRGLVAECTLEHARLLTIGGRGYSSAYAVPLLSDVVRLISAHPGASHLQLDFKNEEPFTSDEPLRRLLGLIEPLGSRVLVSTGADWQLRRLRRLAPRLALGFDPMGYLDWEPAGGTPQVSRADVPTTGSREPAGGTPSPLGVASESGGLSPAGPKGIVSRADAAPPRQDGVPTTGSREPAGGTPQVSRADVPTTGSREPASRMRDSDEHPRRYGVYGYYDDHPLAAMRGWSTADYLADRCESLMGLVPDVSTFYLRHTLLAQSLVDGFNWAEALHRRGIRLDAWTMDVTNPAAMANAPRLWDAGVDLFTTNTPRALAQLLNLKPS